MLGLFYKKNFEIFHSFFSLLIKTCQNFTSLLMDIDLFDRCKILTQLYMRYITLSKEEKNSLKLYERKQVLGF